MSFTHGPEKLDGREDLTVTRAAGRRWIWRWEGWFATTAGAWASAGFAMTRSGALVKAVRKQSRQRQHADAAGDRIVAQAPNVTGFDPALERRSGNGRLYSHEDFLRAGAVPDSPAEFGELACEHPSCVMRATLEIVVTPFGEPAVCGLHADELRRGTFSPRHDWLIEAMRHGPAKLGPRAEWLLAGRPAEDARGGSA